MESTYNIEYKVNSIASPKGSSIHKIFSIQLVKQKKYNSSHLNNSILTSLVYPIIVTIITFLIIRLITRKKDKKDLLRVEAEIEQIKTSFQPIVVSSLQSIQNEVFKDKTSSLKRLIKSKSELFNVQQVYHEGDPVFQDEYQYYEQVYLNFNKLTLSEIKQNTLNNSSLFPSTIRIEFQYLTNKLFEIHDIQDREFSKKNQSMPDDVKTKLITISKSFDKLIDLIRNDLHLDNTFIHDFIAKYQKLKNK